MKRSMSLPSRSTAMRALIRAAASKRRRVYPSLTLAPRNKVPPLRGFPPLFPHYDQYSPRRLEDALSGAYVIGFT